MPGYMEDDVLRMMFQSGGVPTSFLSGMGAAALDNARMHDIHRQQNEQSGRMEQIYAQEKPKGYLDQIYENVSPDYFVGSDGLPKLQNIDSFVDAGKSYADTGDSKMQRLMYEWEQRQNRDATQNQFKSQEGAQNRGLRSLIAWLSGANQGVGALDAPKNAEQFKQEVEPYTQPTNVPSVLPKVAPQAADGQTSGTAKSPLPLKKATGKKVGVTLKGNDIDMDEADYNEYRSGTPEVRARIAAKYLSNGK